MSPYRLKGTSGSVVNQSFPLSGRLVIGRADDCELRIDHESVAPHHAEILLTDQGDVLIRDLGSGKDTCVNGETVTEAALSGGDEVQLGNSRLMLQAPGLRPERVLGAQPDSGPGMRWWWLIPAGLLAAAALAWRLGHLGFPPGTPGG